ncbi:MAG TPA: hypothetical protein VD706_02435 [Candidatus Saccharimonadales bacterium]|nr:hypothetical protein [Candidatus Saccharimonadales bacterium]
MTEPGPGNIVGTQPLTGEIDAPVSPRPRVTNLSLVCISALLEHNGEATLEELERTLGESGVTPERFQPCFENTLQKYGNVAEENGKFVVTAAGVACAADHTGRINEAHDTVRIKRTCHKLPPTRYKILAFLESSAQADGWMLSEVHDVKPLEYLGKGLNTTAKVVERRMVECRRAGHVEQTPSRPAQKGNPIRNFRLTQKGRDQLEAWRIEFASQIANLEAKQTIEAMRSEIDNMCWELGEEIENFLVVEGRDDEDMRAEIRRLEGLMEDLERRLDSKPVVTSGTMIVDGILEETVATL